MKDKHAVYYEEESGRLFFDANGKRMTGGDIAVVTLSEGLGLSSASLLLV